MDRYIGYICMYVYYKYGARFVLSLAIYLPIFTYAASSLLLTVHLMDTEPEKIPFPFDMTGFRRTPNTYPPSRMSDVNRLPIIISWYEGKWHLI